jgi:hypothetical protein
MYFAILALVQIPPACKGGSSMPATTNQYTLTMSETERADQLKILEQSLMEIRTERRRTGAMEYHDEIVREEAVLRELFNRVRNLQS